MLSLKVKAAGLGITSEAFPSTPLEDILLGWDAKVYEVYLASVPAIEAQFGKLSPTQLGKAKREDEDEKAQDKLDCEVGEKIIEEMRERAHFRAMPQVLQGAWVRQFGRWPWGKPHVEPIKGMSAQLAREIIALGPTGKVADSDLYWKAYSKLRPRLHKTAQG